MIRPLNYDQNYHFGLKMLEYDRAIASTTPRICYKFPSRLYRFANLKIYKIIYRKDGGDFFPQDL